MRQVLRIVLPVAAVGASLFALTAGHFSILQLDLDNLLGSSSTPNMAARGDASTQSRLAAPAATAPDAQQNTASAKQAPVSAAGIAEPTKIEVARLDPGGASVIAGRAPAGSKLTLHANGEPIAEVTASEDGQWSAVITRSFPAGPVDLAVSGGAQVPTSARSPVLTVVVPKRAAQPELAVASAGPRPILAAKASVDDARAIGELAALVNKARAIRAEGGAADRNAIVPVPITFVTGQSSMTPHGQLAAALLVEYLRITESKSVTLSGHADERGSDEFNVELSRRRLETIDRHIRDNGFNGRLVLLPKGRSEPYTGIDRTAAAQESILQADRRVQLRLSE